jgi:hypothetical protein
MVTCEFMELCYGCLKEYICDPQSMMLKNKGTQAPVDLGSSLLLIVCLFEQLILNVAV